MVRLRWVGIGILMAVAGCASSVETCRDERCPEGYICDAGECVAVCNHDADCMPALSCVDGACRAVNSECTEHNDCAATDLCKDSICLGGLCRGEHIWPVGSADLQPVCALSGEDANANGEQEDEEHWTGYCTHAGACVPCTEDVHCDDSDPCSIDLCTDAVCESEANAACGVGCRPCEEGEPPQEERLL